MGKKVILKYACIFTDEMSGISHANGFQSMVNEPPMACKALKSIDRKIF